MLINDSLRLSLTESLANLESLTEAPSDEVQQLLWKIAKRQEVLMRGVETWTEADTTAPETIQQFSKKLMAQAGSLSTLAALHPTLTSVDLTQPIGDEIAKAVRAQFVEVFSQTGTFIGRNSPEAVKADAKLTIMKSFESGSMPAFVTMKGRGNASDPKGFIDRNIAGQLDNDQNNYRYNPELFAFLNKGTRLHPLYKSIYNIK